MQPFWAFYGGKWRAAPRYPAPRFDRIIEPFAGAAGYATRHYHLDVVLVEKDPVIAALWRYLIAASPSDIFALPLMRADQTIDDLDVRPEAKSLIGFWLNKGAASPCRTPSAWMRAGTHATSFWGERIRQRIAEQVEAIKHWTVIEGSYADAPDETATWFIDPPYIDAGKYYRCAAGAIDFSHLADWCRARRGQVMVCENNGATWLPFQPFLSIKSNPSSRGKGRSAEALWQDPTSVLLS